MTTTIIIPAAGEGSRFVTAGYSIPKPFIPVHGMPMLECVLRNLELPDVRHIVLARDSHLEAQRAVVEELTARFDLTWVGVARLTAGTACTLLLAESVTPLDDPLLVANSDQLVLGCDGVARMVREAEQKYWDGAILVFECDGDPKWSYARVADGHVVEVAEKKPISHLATVGIYYFSKARYFFECARDMIAADDRVGNEFYTCPVYNYLIHRGLEVGVTRIPPSAMVGMGTPEDLERYLEQGATDPAAAKCA